MRMADFNHAECAPGLYNQNLQCVPCVKGKYCLGGGLGLLTSCPSGLATIIKGAKSKAQVSRTAAATHQDAVHRNYMDGRGSIKHSITTTEPPAAARQGNCHCVLTAAVAPMALCQLLHDAMECGGGWSWPHMPGLQEQQEPWGQQQ
jgi:hypothetical protein